MSYETSGPALFDIDNERQMLLLNKTVPSEVSAFNLPNQEVQSMKFAQMNTLIRFNTI